MLRLLVRSKGAKQVSWSALTCKRAARTGAPISLILKQEVENLGSAGEQVYVNQGYAHNWLLPQKLAIYDLNAWPGGKRPRKQKAEARDQKGDKRVQTASVSEEQLHLEDIVRRLLSSPVVVKRKFRRGTILEGQVTAGTIKDTIAKQKKIDVVRELIELEAPIIEHGTYDVPLGIIMPDGEQAKLEVNVVLP